ncbi:GGDEF domain-containing protein [Rhizobium sp. FY34]|uniref:GGDEF domain-containing protein n=1 Tax=Rhizobium sp. FY34 TaxID=2562309 RepID=UPI0010BFE50B|nr:GGDEF domain-containing protein [Rhizobium sp. FY34]
MNGANFFLVVNLLVSLSFSTVFMIVSTRSRSRVAARWIACAYAVASLSTIAELLVAYTDWVKIFAIAAFASVLGGLLLMRVGIGKLYGVPAHPQALCLFFCFSIVVDFLIYDLPRGTWTHSISYQTPFAIALFLSGLAVLISARRSAIDRVMMVLLILAGIQFLAKAAMSVMVGAGKGPKDYIHSNYALISQSSTGVFVVIIGLMLLSVFVLEIMADERTNSQVDALSQVFNRRGFDAHCEMALRRAKISSHVVILCDLDHFKRVNDTYGHYSGDLVIRSFADLLQSSAPPEAVVGRLGGEEFCVMLPDVTMESALMLAQALRGAIAMQTISGLPQNFRVTASFGLAALTSSGDLSSAMRRADAALYDAKAAGRNCVRVYREPLAIALASN